MADAARASVRSGPRRRSPTNPRRSRRTRASTTASSSPAWCGVSLAADPIGFQVKVFFLGLRDRGRALRGGDRQSTDPGRPGRPGRARAGRRPRGRVRASERRRRSQAHLRERRQSADHRSRPRSRSMTAADATARLFDPDDDDRLIGRVLSRREVLALMGAVSVGAVAVACAPGSAGVRGRDGGCVGRRRGDGPRHRHGRRRREFAAVLRRRPGADRGPVLRQREPRPVRHPRSTPRTGPSPRERS